MVLCRAGDASRIEKGLCWRHAGLGHSFLKGAPGATEILQPRGKPVYISRAVNTRVGKRGDWSNKKAQEPN